MAWRGKPTEAIISEGKQLLLNDVRNLINRHYVAELDGLEKWPAEWKYWSHGDEGTREYEEERRHSHS